MSEIRGGHDAAPFRAKVFIPCLVSRCMVPNPAGGERRSRMQLITLREDGALLQRPFNEGPHYKCEREGCHYRDNPRGVHELNSEWIRAYTPLEPKKKDGDNLTMDERMTML